MDATKYLRKPPSKELIAGLRIILENIFARVEQQSVARYEPEEVPVASIFEQPFH